MKIILRILEESFSYGRGILRNKVEQINIYLE